MTEDDKKLLTEKLLGECWHEFKSSAYFSFPDRCLTCGKLITSLSRRTFTTWTDLGDVKDKLVVTGEWEEFLTFSAELTAGYFTNRQDNGGMFYGDKMIAWLFRPTDDQGRPHFCKLVCEYLKEGK